MKLLSTKLALVLLASVATVPVSSARAAEQDQAPLDRAKVEFEIKAGKSVIKFDPKTLDLGEQATFVVEQDDHQHELRARVESGADAAKVNVVLDYMRDKQTVLEGVSLQLPIGGEAAKPAGKSRIKVRVSRGEPKSHKIDMPEGDDPLTGL